MSSSDSDERVASEGPNGKSVVSRDSKFGRHSVAGNGTWTKMVEVGPGFKCAMQRQGQAINYNLDSGIAEIIVPEIKTYIKVERQDNGNSQNIFKDGSSTGIIAPRDSKFEEVLDWFRTNTNDSDASQIASLAAAKLKLACIDAKKQPAYAPQFTASGIAALGKEATR